MTHYFIFSNPVRGVSFTFVVNPHEISTMKPRQRGKTLSGLEKNLATAGKHLMCTSKTWGEVLPFSDFKNEVLDFATSEIGQTGPTQ